ncbi:O-linked N-acetylglucosamine transferase, SPINDLY family protein [Dokdonella immobilis]|uniref:protein O-GlcNAc transferase n=1 Tax=Dokdonella immobilis TaxID=578942 RepID=A0A1I4V9G2_9GAMM|nr:tetratricopeptide repeat protein [Dokdonella immobilis]SFM97818.1 Predicted O-linked N-acetylglucosamine transferase, SPINDLY family [Dokdonella immobilis]
MSAASLQQMMGRATQHHRAGNLEEAKALYREVLKSQPGNPDALHLFGLACHQQGDHATAVAYIRQAVERVPEQPVLRNNLGDALHKAGDLTAAAEQLQQALKLRADYAGAHMNLGVVLSAAGEHEKAIVHSREATRLDPEWPEAWFNRGMLELDQVRLADSVQSFRSALALRPTYRAAANSLLYVLNLLPDLDPADVAEEHGCVANGLFGQVRAATAWPEPGARLRIGYVSGDFRAHAVNCFFEPLLAHHDTDRFEVFCYSDVPHADGVTARLQGLASKWRDVRGESDEAVASLIRSDRIDILVDLAGHTEHGRLGVFAARPARCQISYLGYPNTTGLSAMDYRIVDGCTAPDGEMPMGTEHLLRLVHGFACFRPPSHAPDVEPAPLSRNGFVTFGSLHKLEKVNARVISSWARILRENPGSRLLLARDQLDHWHQRRLEVAFGELGIAAERLQLVHLSNPGQSFFRIFSDIDILLDVFPWSGHTIACCALWSGVPVVTLRGNTHAGRMVASVLEGLGATELIGNDGEAYVRIATALCRDPQRLLGFREGLRARMETSPLRDESGFVASLESRLQSLVRQTT